MFRFQKLCRQKALETKCVGTYTLYTAHIMYMKAKYNKTQSCEKQVKLYCQYNRKTNITQFRRD